MAADDAVRLRAALCGALHALDAARLDSLIVGGIAIRYYLQGEVSFDHDVDLFIRGSDVERAIAVLEEAGFEVFRMHPTWLFKARHEDATVDVLYVLGHVLKLDDEMLARAKTARIGEECSGLIVSREDLAVGQAGASSDAVMEHWFEAVDLLRSGDVDWGYIRRRSVVAPDRIAALLHYARSVGINVPAGLDTIDATSA